MNALHISNKPIFPVLDGGQYATERLLTNLIDLGFSVKHICIETHKHPFSEKNYPKALRTIVHPEAHFIDTRIKVFDVFKSLFTSESYNVKRFIDPKFGEKIKEILQANEYGLVILESIYLLPYINVIRYFSDAKIVVRTHNVEYRIWRQLAHKEKSIFKRYYFRKLAKNLKNFEIKHLNLVDGIFCISEQDKEFFRRRSVAPPMEVIPVYLDKVDNFEVNYENNDYFFIGSMSWKPNVDAVQWIVNQIAPRMQKSLPEARIHIAGSSMSRKMLNKKVKNIIFHGKVENMYEFMSQHGTLIVPLKTGSGVRIKILDALSAGIPIISTEKGKEGINLTAKKHFLTANLTEEFALQMKLLNDNTELKRSLGEEGKKFIEEEYSLEVVSKKIRDFIAKI